ncbi:prevent-host-death family protein, antitoxin of a toxin/antitoxin system, phd-like protein [Canicola haemoglobinophilus]|uniref:Antitoxin n=1 Tax=Canicola haemoglobinophilus TaxID=733 RepID=A0AB38H9D9_9PAST|nr:type II toxin-antitoxin system prevent-host-death family antitoxin [Canicola haemoglobinophilus]STO53716.1 prevent-host-death family protein, antitoxin of a toxin/antitoxin system, phd-like protein [Canicola haemoglobinophilus]STO68249.1 prevent-host-death family protein, antitoxin of a toxin/antitoxin system, phd-like protein [Canicola haemoglobinophilus]
MNNAMTMVNIHEAKTNLSKIVDEVKKLGKPMVIAKAGKPQVKIVPLEQPEISTRFGFMTEPSNIPDNFDQMYTDEIQALFEGNS